MALCYGWIDGQRRAYDDDPGGLGIAVVVGELDRGDRAPLSIVVFCAADRAH